MRKTPIKQKKTNPMLKNIKINTTTKSLVLIDQKPIRKSYIKDCQKVIKKIDSLKLQIQHFEKADKPAYGNWINTQFGDEILYIRQKNQELEEKQLLLEEIEEEAHYYNLNLHQAYLRVQHKREHPEEYQDEEPYSEDEEPKFGDYEDFDDAKEDDDELEKEFREFMNDFFDAEDAKFGKDFFEDMDGIFNLRKKKEKEPVDNRLKDRYRYIVQKLHPDSNQNQSDFEKELWFEIQEAYQLRDLEKMDMLIALYNIRKGETEKESSVFELKYTLNILNKSQNYLKKMLTQVKKDPSWNFLTFSQKKLQDIKKKLKTEFREYTEVIEFELMRINSIFEEIKKEPKPKQRRSKTTKSNIPIKGQLDFGF
ncbi:MAG: hypothetical protein H7A23_17285 [Leptospiraceae bacterium]|nr:hypothetical protein [Leptospiraceae bacterium]MCP5496302.1 hypothetical protein [Leptospiraceae bacterium]